MENNMSSDEQLVMDGIDFLTNIFATGPIRKEVHEALQPVIGELAILSEFLEFVIETGSLPGVSEDETRNVKTDVIKSVFQLGFDIGVNSVTFKDEQG